MVTRIDEENLKECRNFYLANFQKYLEESQELDGYLLEKLALSMMLNYIMANQSGEAMMIWNPDESVEPESWTGFLAQGAGLIESQPCLSDNDMMLYFQICTFLHSSNRVAGRSPEEKAEAVDRQMGVAFEHYFNQGYPRLPTVMASWLYLLRKIFDQSPPPQALTLWEKCAKRFPPELQTRMKAHSDSIQFMPLDSWIA